MNPFKSTRATSLDFALLEGTRGGRFIAGGTTLVDLMRRGVERPGYLVAINKLAIRSIQTDGEGNLTIGALATNSDVAHHPAVTGGFQMLSEAILSGATTQIRNMATTGGNLLQRTRCVYFRDERSPCNKRQPGSGCPALTGYHRNLAILGTSEDCIATNPSDQNVALTALDAVIDVESVAGKRSVPITEFFVLPGSTPERENVLEPGEMIVSVRLPKKPGWKSHYLKLRDRQSYEFALASAGVAVQVRDGTIEDARLALGGVGTIPWRVPAAEAVLRGQAPSAELFAKAADVALAGASPNSGNAFKVELAKRCVVKAFAEVTE